MIRDFMMMVVACGAVFESPTVWAASKITALEFNGTSNPPQLVIKADGPLQYNREENAQDKQIVLEIKDAQLAKKSLERKLDTSSFNAPVSLISPYELKDQGTVRVVLQMRDNADVSIAEEGNSLRVKLAAAGSSPAAGAPAAPVAENAPQATVPLNDAPPASSEASQPPASEPAPLQAGPNDQPPAEENSNTKAASVDQPVNEIDSFLQRREARSYVGKPITLQLRETDVADVFRLIAESSGFNIIIGPDVKGKVTLSLSDVPWDLALDTVMQTLHLGGRRSANVLRISTLQTLTQEELEETKARLAQEANAPRVTKIFPISYANAGELVTLLTAFGAASNPPAVGGAGAGAAAPVVPTFAQVDQRTNSIVVQDTTERMKKISKLVEILDTQTPQVMIEAKIVEATEAFSKTVGGSLGLGGTGTSQFLGTFNGANPVDPLLGSSGAVFTGQTAAGQSLQGGLIGVSPQLTFLPGVTRLNALLNMGETENAVRVIASPKTVVLNKQQAQITQGTPVLVPTVQVIPGVGQSVVNQVAQANLSLQVTPTITSDGSVMLRLQVQRDIPIQINPTQSGIGSRNLSTNVMVESGSTLVIGGIYTMSQQETSSGFPLLRKIPIIGALFGTETEATNRSELFIFITPRILNEKEAGLAG